MHCTDFDFEASMISPRTMHPPQPERAASVRMFGSAIAIALCTALAGCSASKSADDQGAGTLPTAGTVSISGTTAVGQTLTAVPSGFTMGTPAGSYHYVWQRCADSGCASTTDVGTDSPTYTLAEPDVGFYVWVNVYVSNTCASGCGSSATVYSEPTVMPGTMPTAGTVSISGTWAFGQTLTAVPSGFTLGTPTGSYH